MLFRGVIAIFLMIIFPYAFADTLDISLNNNAESASYSFSSGGGAEMSVGMQYNDSTNSLVYAGILAKGEDSDSSGMSIAVGAKLLAGLIRNFAPGVDEKVGSVVIGGDIGFVSQAFKQLSGGIHYFAGPSITTFGDATRANLWGLFLNYEVSPGTKVYAEYREADFGISSYTNPATLDNGTYVGVKLTF
jgi:predicted porin